jgi:hypothetical protein
MKRLGLAALAVLGLVLGLVAAETMLRALPDPVSRKAYMVPDAVYHHRLLPNFDRVVLGARFTTNSLALRDREYAIPKPPGVFRVFMLGDSFTEGGGLRLEETVAKRVEAGLREGRCGSSAEVVDGGHASYSPILEYLLLRDVGVRLQPDLVVLNFDMTDVHDDFIRTQLATLDDHGLPIAVPQNRRRETALIMPPVGPRFLRPLEHEMADLALYQAFRKSNLGLWLFGRFTVSPEEIEAKGLTGDLHYDRLAVTRDVDSEQLRSAWARTARYIVGIRDLARRHGAELVLVVYPHAHQVSATASPIGRRRMGIGAGLFTSPRPFEIIEALGRRESIPVINLLQLFRDREATGGPLFRHDDIHHTPRGSAVFAEGILDGLRTLRLIDCDRDRSRFPAG